MNIAVYCGSAVGNDPAYARAAQALGTWLAEAGHTLIYGGGRTGLMGVVADAVLRSGGQAIGIVPEFLISIEGTHRGLTRLEIVQTMAERKARMLSLADACIALPGGPGTLEEIFEVISHGRLKQHDKAALIYNVNGYYDPLAAFFDSMIRQAFVRADEEAFVHIVTNLEEIKEVLA